ncbi:sensor histidine kinase [Dongia sp.]|uniref:sensor histidine kinase n=1 Tax=Dongia sp. TaxID=1977262 RepID=UPI003753E402
MIEDQTSEQRRRGAAVEALVPPYAELATENASTGLWFWKSEPDLVWMNPYCCKLVGANDGEIVNLETFLGHLAGLQNQTERRSLLDAVRSSGVFQDEFKLRDGAGNVIWVQIAAQSVGAGATAGIAGTLRNITDFKSLQQEAEQLRRQVIHLTRVSTLGELSGAVAHELNQPLTAILSNAQAGQRLLNRNAASPEEICSILEDIIEDDRRAGAVLTRLRNLIRNEQVDFSEVDLNEVVAEVFRLVHSEMIERRVEVVLDCTPVLPPVRADRIQIQQVLINLVRNACDAMAAVRWSEHRLTVKTGRRCDESVVITVADNGTGLSDELRSSLFEPFVTTKRNGMGLGLTISRAIISGHRGEIWHEENPGGGSVFGFSLPAVKRRDAWPT